MPEFVCPGCQAEIKRDLIEKSGRPVCPFCAANLSALGLPQPAERDASDGADRCWTRDQGELHATGEVSRPLPAIPDKSRIKIVESTSDRMVLFIPGGGKQSGGLGCFALAWNGFMCVFTPLMVGGIMKDQGGNAPSLLFVIPFVSLFWAVGLGFAWFWLKFKYERTFVLLDRGRIVIQKTLFNRKQLDETSLGPDSCAELVESYQQNDTPVYRIEVRGTSGEAKFGTALSDDEKNWLVDRINEFLGVSLARHAVETDADQQESASNSAALDYPNDCAKCGAPLPGEPENGVLTCVHCGAVHRGTRPESLSWKRPAALPEPFERLTPESLPQESGIRVLESSPERLVFLLALPARSPLRWIVPLFTLPFAVGWYSFIVSFAWNVIRAPFGWFGILPLLFLVPFMAAGLMPLGIGLYAIAGNTTVTVTRERVSCRWGVGPFGYTRQVPTEAVHSVRVEHVSSEGGNCRVRGNKIRAQKSGGGIGDSRACVVRGAGKLLPLTVLEDAACARQVASLVRTKLEDLGHPLTDA